MIQMMDMQQQSIKLHLRLEISATCDPKPTIRPPQLFNGPLVIGTANVRAEAFDIFGPGRLDISIT
jgi:hypothetical protein